MKKYCLECGKRLIRGRFSGIYLEPPWTFRIRCFCNHVCAGLYKRQSNDRRKEDMIRLRKKLSLSEIGKLYKITKQRVSQIVNT